MKQLRLFLVLFLLSFGFLMGCTNDSGNEETRDETSTEKMADTTQDESDESLFPITFTDDSGAEITVEGKPERIITLIPSNTEIAFALGLEDEVVAVTENDNFPEAALEKDTVGGYELNIEKIISLEPDLILAHELNVPDGINQLRDAGLPVVIIGETNQMEGVYDSIRLIGKSTGTTAKAEELVRDMETKLAEIEAKVSGVSETEQKQVYLEISPEPEIYTAGKDTFFNYLLMLVNAGNIFGEEEGWIQVSEEAVIEANPDMIIAAYNFVENAVDEILARSAWKDIAAIQQKQVVQIDEDIVSRPGPRLVEGVEELAKAIYPELFQD